MPLAQAFIESFDGEKVRLGRKTFIIFKTMIAHATQSSTTGENWFRSKALPEELISYLKHEYADLKWNSPAHISCFKAKWQHVITSIQKYITREEEGICSLFFDIGFLGEDVELCETGATLVFSRISFFFGLPTFLLELILPKPSSLKNLSQVIFFFLR